jgi:hypothetical protein
MAAQDHFRLRGGSSLRSLSRSAIARMSMETAKASRMPAGIGLAAAGGILVIVGLQALWEERITLLRDDWQFRRSLRY